MPACAYTPLHIWLDVGRQEMPVACPHVRMPACPHVRIWHRRGAAGDALCGMTCTRRGAAGDALYGVACTRRGATRGSTQLDGGRSRRRVRCVRACLRARLSSLSIFGIDVGHRGCPLRHDLYTTWGGRRRVRGVRACMRARPSSLDHMLGPRDRGGRVGQPEASKGSVRHACVLRRPLLSVPGT